MRVRGGGGGGGGGGSGSSGGMVAGAGKAIARWRVSLGKFFRSLGLLLMRHPSVWAVPVLTMLVLAAAGAVGVVLAAQDAIDQQVMSAQGFADNAAVSINTQMEVIGAAPLLALAAFVQEEPSLKSLERWFQPVTRKLLTAIPGPRVAALQVAPQGVVGLSYPAQENKAALGLDLFRSKRDRASALEAVTSRNMTMAGPKRLVQGFTGVMFRLPVFIQNVGPEETFGAPEPAYECGAPCYDPSTRSKFWGFVTAVVNADAIVQGTDMRLKRLEELGYSYSLHAPQPGGAPPVFVAGTPDPPSGPVTASVPLPGGREGALAWQLLVAPSRGWVPKWRGPMLAVVAVASVAVGALTFAILVNRRRLIWVVDELQATNVVLANEKRRTDVLLARQYDLICCAVGQHKEPQSGGAAGPGGGSGDAPGGHNGRVLVGNGQLQGFCSDKRRAGEAARKVPGQHAAALERIEEMRREINSPAASVGALCHEEVELMELLGEGTFGRVYRGLWRGSEVAIKVVILPARMSGVEKREKMAIMETAISSAMHHPNILQTYTYTIKPVNSSYARETSTQLIGGTEQHSEGCSFTPSGSTVSGGAMQSDQHTHNFEVSLILEYCDLGTLRDALNAKAFLLDSGQVNYAAVLEIAAEVASAMLHLHKQQVIHSDLKARNVLLKTDGRGGKGAVAKVADFGLSVRIDMDATHVSEFQGTLSHMAPETQIHRHITKACDVFSFGITLWELFSGGHVHQGVPILLLGHKVAIDGLRPLFPQEAPEEYRRLAESCWAREPRDRPTFRDILSALNGMRERLGGATPPLRRYTPRTPQEARRQLQQREERARQEQDGRPQDTHRRQQQDPAPQEHTSVTILDREGAREATASAAATDPV